MTEKLISSIITVICFLSAYYLFELAYLQSQKNYGKLIMIALWMFVIACGAASALFNILLR